MLFQVCLHLSGVFATTPLNASNVIGSKSASPVSTEENEDSFEGDISLRDGERVIDGYRIPISVVKRLYDR